MNINEQYMIRALQLAKLGAGHVAPNPLVGCVIVHKNQIIAEGYHRQFGGPHAEPNAISQVKNKQVLKDATLYVTLEPCSHFGKTPPCADLIVQSGIPKVVIATVDPFAQVQGRGIKKLRDAGIEVEVGLCEAQAQALNKRFFTFHKHKRPYIILKWAQTKDGFIDHLRSESEKPLQISNKENQTLVHQWRSEEDAILIGANTLLKDNPSLNTRLVHGSDPLKVVYSLNSKPIDFQKFKLFDSGKHLVYSVQNQSISPGIEAIQSDNFGLKDLLGSLHQRNIQSLLVEGGRKTLQAFINEGLWDEARITSSDFAIETGVPAPSFEGKLKDQFSCGKACIVSLFSRIDNNAETPS